MTRDVARNTNDIVRSHSPPPSTTPINRHQAYGYTSRSMNDWSAMRCVVTTLAVLVAANAVYASIEHAFPRNESWLAWASTTVDDAMVTSVTAQLYVPNSPTQLLGTTSPGWYIAVLSEDMQELIRGVIAWGDYRSQFTVFSEQFSAIDRTWVQSRPGHIYPGALVKFNLTYVEASHSYTVVINRDSAILSENIEATFSVRSNVKYPYVFVVMEHEPTDCSQLPSQPGFAFQNITINGAESQQWDCTNCNRTVMNACKANIKPLSSTALQFAWNTE
eukprot:m.192380 g.192380  ORF g.192380 m.192380 type:complete len:276 (-) comp14854_c0_seq3:1893-2720(-)